MIACPPTEERQPRGGTWYTIGYAQKVCRPLVVITPSGLVGYSGIWPWRTHASSMPPQCVE